MSDLNKKTCKELREIAKGYAIKGRWEMTKQELIEAIEDITIDNSGLSDKDIIFETNCVINEENQIQSEGSQNVLKTTKEYLHNAEVGTLVAFKRNSKDIAMSGKLVSFDENGKVNVQSKKGTIFKLMPENIIWVKTGNRWPKWVFNMFNNETCKGVNNDNAIS